MVRVAASAASSSAIPEELAALAAPAGAALAGGLVVAGAAPGRRGEMTGGREDAHVGADLATRTSAVRSPTPVIVLASVTPDVPVGPSSASIASESWQICSSRKSRCARIAPMISA